ncbi:MAG: hypothetical protein OER90_10300, partial [Gemmatimonadota bacterium]|nr:hypothetical protein [Gemmatimonadota bacterium]
RIADAGIPVYVVPGNHERSAIPFPMLAEHPGIHIFDRPRTFTVEWEGVRVAVAGFPFCRRGVRGAFPSLLGQAEWKSVGADVNLLCVHQCFEGATVGPKDFTFRYTDDVVKADDVPSPFAAVLTGHIHRHQVLTADLRGRPLPTPVLYPGSIERTSFAERDEEKGYLVLQVEPAADRGGILKQWTFYRLPARPMVLVDVEANGFDFGALRALLIQAITEASADAVLRIRVHGKPAPAAFAALRAAHVRGLAPATMNVEVVLVDVEPGGRRL